MKTLFVLLFSLVLSIPQLFAMQVRGGDSYTVQAPDTIRDDALYFGRTLNIQGSVESDVYFMGEVLTVDGHIGDDVLIFGRRAIIRGEVQGNVFFFGEELRVEGTIHGSIRSFGKNIQILPGAVVEGNIYSGSKWFLLKKAVVKGSLQGGAGKITLDGSVNGSIDFNATEVEFGPDFRTENSVKLTLPHPVTEPLPKAPANLEIVVKPPKPFYKSPIRIWWAVSTFLMGVLFVITFPGVNWEMGVRARQQWLKVAGIGLVFILIWPVFTVIALIIPPLMFISGGLYLTLLYMSKLLAASVVGQWVGQKLFGGNKRQSWPPVVAYTVGFIGISLIELIPIVGFLATVLFSALGLGALILVLWQQYRSNSDAIQIEN